MLRYLAIVADRAQPDPEGMAARIVSSLLQPRSAWREAFATAMLRVFVTGNDTCSEHVLRLHADAGVILGTLFERRLDALDDSVAMPARLSASVSTALCESRGRRLIDAFWGEYVAFLLDAHERRVHVIRDPVGSLPCYCVRMQNLIVFFSHVADLVTLDIVPLRLSTTYLRTRIVSGGYAGADGPLETVLTVQRGECFELSLRKHATTLDRHCYWHPLRFTRAADRLEDPALAARALRASVRACVHTWAARHHRILHRLSGGLDSSIVLACVASAPARPQLLCYTYYTPGGRSDERPWARLAAQAAGCAHIEQAVDPAAFDIASPLRLPLSMEPLSVIEFLHRERNERPLAARHGATAIFCGEGGDSGFGKHSIAFCLIQHLQHHGLTRRTLEIALNVALFTQQTLWTVLFRSMRRWLFGSRMSDQRRELMAGTRLVHRDLVASLASERRYPHPWFQDLKDVPWATINQLGMLPYGVEFADDAVLHPDTPSIVSPLYAQPVIELLLRIPVYVHFESGCERGLARRAFEGEVPAPILQRYWKDRAPGLEEILIARHRHVLREILLDGVLVREQLLDRRAVASALDGRVHKDEILPGEIFKHLDLELWARNWQASATPGARTSPI